MSIRTLVEAELCPNQLNKSDHATFEGGSCQPIVSEAVPTADGRIEVQPPSPDVVPPETCTEQPAHDSGLLEQHSDVASSVVETAARRISPPAEAPPQRDGCPEDVAPRIPIELGRVVQSPNYGRGYIVEIEEDGVKVRFWRHGYRRFRRIEAGYPFKLIDEVRPFKSPAKNVAGHCQHGKRPHFCCKCAGLADGEIEKWKRYRTAERPIIRRGNSNLYTNVKISGNDCVLTSRLETNAIQEAPPSGEEEGLRKQLHADPNSRFQRGGTGYLRIPLDEPRNTRMAAPKWLDRREEFLKTLKASRAARAEQILSEFYVDGKTDTQIGGALGWTKDAVKKERVTLIKGGNDFFMGGSNTPLAPL